MSKEIFPLPPILTLSLSSCPGTIPPNVDVLLIGHGEEPNETDLKEMQEVLHICERHGAACPRTTEPGTWTSFPLETSIGVPMDADAVARGHADLSSLLPRYAVVPAAPCWPLLVRGELMCRFGGPDYLEADPVALSLKLSRYGYSTVVAHRVLFRPSNGTESKALSISAVMSDPSTQRPDIKPLLNYYLNREVSPLEHFASLFGSPRRPRILYSLYALAPVYNGFAEHGLSLLRELQTHYTGRYELTVLAPEKAADFHGLHRDYPRVVAPGDPLGMFDLGFSPSQVMQWDHLLLLDRHCLRVTFTLLDLIKARTGYMRSPVGLDTLRLAVGFAEGIVTNSEAVKADARSFFGSMFDRPDQIVKTIYIGIDLEPSLAASVPDAPEPGFILVVGNYYVHKAVREAIMALAPEFKNIVVLGDSADGDLPAGVQHFPSGKLAPELVDSLYRRCSVLVFPSQYEGFGLPVARALSLDKPVVLFTNATNKEIISSFARRSDQAVFCTTFNELAEGVAKVLISNDQHIRQVSVMRTWTDAAVDHANFIDEVLHRPLSGEHLEKRREVCQLFGAVWASEEALTAKRQPSGMIERAFERIMPLMQPLRAACPKAYDALASLYRRFFLNRVVRRRS
jgi:glycosyltransferase involved in cell wall biosynthesis